MQRSLPIGLCLAAALAAAGCDSKWARDDALSPTANTLPAVARPVGPIPGPHDAPPQPKNPVAGDRQAIWDGRELFVRFNCYGCHGGRAGGGMGPSLRDPVWTYGGNDADIFDSIAEGRAHGMPTWGTRLTEMQIWRLVAYIDSLGTPLEPKAPQ